MTARLLKTRILPVFVAVLSLFLSLSEARASERVVVSVPPLHTLVSYLLAGVDQPELLFTDPSQTQETVPMPTALSKIQAAKVAVGRIAPNLTRLYPDHVEQILDNEIALKKRLTDMEHHFRQVLGTPHCVPLNVPESDVLYLAWRFNLAAPNCPGAAQKIEGFDGSPGAKDYFKMMDAILSDLKACQI